MRRPSSAPAAGAAAAKLSLLIAAAKSLLWTQTPASGPGRRRVGTLSLRAGSAATGRRPGPGWVGSSDLHRGTLLPNESKSAAADSEPGGPDSRRGSLGVTSRRRSADSHIPSPPADARLESRLMESCPQTPLLESPLVPIDVYFQSVYGSWYGSAQVCCACISRNPEKPGKAFLCWRL